MVCLLSIPADSQVLRFHIYIDFHMLLVRVFCTVDSTWWPVHSCAPQFRPLHFSPTNGTCAQSLIGHIYSHCSTLTMNSRMRMMRHWFRDPSLFDVRFICVKLESHHNKHKKLKKIEKKSLKITLTCACSIFIGCAASSCGQSKFVQFVNEQSV